MKPRWRRSISKKTTKSREKSGPRRRVLRRSQSAKLRKLRTSIRQRLKEKIPPILTALLPIFRRLLLRIRGISEASETLKTFENDGDNKIRNDDTPERKDKERFVEEGKFGFEFPARMDTDKPMQGWEMLEMVLNWVSKEFSPDEQALARQLANNEISYRFLWLHFVPGSIVSIEDPVSKQQMAARVLPSTY
jgi:hypothetical protein